MKKYPSVFFSKLSDYSICTLLLAGFLAFSNVSATSQGFYKKRKDRASSSNNKKSKVQWKKNILWLEGLGSSQVVSVKYDRIFMFGAVVSMRVDLGVTPFVLDEKYNFIVGRSITPITGLGFYFHVVPFPVKIGLGASVLHDIYFDRIPETKVDTTGGIPNPYAPLTYKARVMPYAVVEVTIKDRLTIKAGYTPIIDPPNEAQKEVYFTNWGTIGFGYKFGR